MTERNIAIGIDSTKAEAGGRVVKRQFDDIGKSATDAEKKIDKGRDALGRFTKTGETANDNLKSLANNAKAAGNNVSFLGGAITSAMGNLARLAPMLLAAGTALAGFLGGALALKQFIQNTIEAERVQSQLAAAIKSTGGVAGQSVAGLNAHAAALQKMTIYEDDAIGKMQALLLTFTKIRGSEFQGATAAVLDMATAMGGDLQGAALQVGKAMNDPIAGVSALGRAGVQFTEAQKTMIKSLVESGKRAEAQRIILKELETQFGGSAKAARETLGGALTALSNTWGNAFELPKTATEGLRLAIEGLVTALSSPAFTAFMQAIGTALVTALTGVVNMVTMLIGLVETLSANLDILAVAAAAAGTALLLVSGPAIIAGVVGLGVAYGGVMTAIQGATTALIAFALANPITAFVLAVTAAVTAVYYFRDEIQKALGIDVVQIAKDTVNILIGSFMAAWEDIKAAWDAFPDMMGAAWVGGVNLAIEQLNRLTGVFTSTMDGIIAGLNKLGAGLTPIGDSLKLDPIFNHYQIALELAIKDRNKAIDEALSTDWLGKIAKVFTPQAAAPAPAATTPGLKTSSDAANDNTELGESYTKIVDGANNSIRALTSEAQALTLTGQAAAVFREQQTLINSALDQGIILTDAQRKQLEALGAQMAAMKAQNAGATMLQGQQSEIGRLQLERQLITATTAEREKALAVYDAEQQMIQKGIDLQSQQAAAIRANAAASAQLQLENERIAAAYSTIQQTGASAIDSLVAGATTVGNSWKDTFKNIATSFVQTFTQLAVANPLKNMLLGTNLPTIQDLFAGKSAAAFTPGTTSTGTMSVTAGVVTVNGGMVPGANSTLGSVLGVPNSIANNTTPGVNTPAATAIMNGVRPSLGPNGIVNSPVAATGGMPAGLSSNEAMAWQHFTNQGMQPHQVAAVMGNIKAESAWNPAAVGDGGNAFGLAQWNDRGPAMKAYVGPNWQNDPQGQLNFMSHEMATSENPAYNRLMASTNVEQANAAMMSFERPSGFSLANPSGGHNYAGRLSNSQNYLAASQNSQSLPGAEQASQSLNKLSTSSVKASTDVSALSTGADTASKALSTSTSSVSSSVSSLASTTQQIPQQTQGLFSSMLSSIGGGMQSLFSGLGSILGGLFADGGVFKNGNVTAFASGGVVGGPTMFPMRSGIGLMGEAGPEAIMPLKRGPGGSLGVQAIMGKNFENHGGPSVQRIEMNTTIKVEGVGDKDLIDKIGKGVDEKLTTGFKAFSRDALPTRVKEIQSDRWGRG